MIIEVKNLKKTYKTFKRENTFKEILSSLFVREEILVEALRGISFKVDEGEIIGFLGPNGAGKSTTLKILSGILYPTSGDVDIMGYIPWKERKKYVSNIGAVFGQKSQLIWDIPPIDSFYMNKAIYDIPDGNFKNTMNEMVELLEVSQQILKPTRQLSLGERMKCEFIMAMLHKPKIIFLDEPTIGLDVIAKEKIRDFIHQMNKNGTTFILTTHDLEDVERLAKRVIIVNHGEIVFDDSIDSLRSFSGLKKEINITTKNPIPDFSKMPGVAVSEVRSLYNTKLVLDISKNSLNSFIQAVNRNCIINDMTIAEPQIESVIKELYSSKAIK